MNRITRVAVETTGAWKTFVVAIPWENGEGVDLVVSGSDVNTVLPLSWDAFNALSIAVSAVLAGEVKIDVTVEQEPGSK